jgi:tetratricopeptide (TPR) repeat protein
MGAHRLFTKIFYKEIFMTIGDKINALINKGSEAYDEKKYDDAIDAFKKALTFAEEHFPDNPNNQEIRDQINYAKQAKEFVKKRNEAAANEAEQWASTFGGKIKDFEGFIKDKDDLLSNNPDGKGAVAMAYYICGLTLMSKGEHVKAIEYFSNAMDYEPDSIRFYQKKPEVFQERYNAYFNGLPPSNYAGTLALDKRAQEYNFIEDFDKAIADFERLIKFFPGYNVHLSNAYMNRGIAYDEKNEYDRAISDFEKALEYNRDNSNASEWLEVVKDEKANQ